MKQPKREYKYTHYNSLQRTQSWEAVITVNGVKHRKAGFKTEREAALEADKMLLYYGKEPVNILKRK